MMGACQESHYDWSAEVRRLQMPVMLVYADHDTISTQHIAEFFALLGDGHYNFYTAPELGPIIEKFLADSLTKPQGGEAAAASKATQ